MGALAEIRERLNAGITTDLNDHFTCRTYEVDTTYDELSNPTSTSTQLLTHCLERSETETRSEAPSLSMGLHYTQKHTLTYDLTTRLWSHSFDNFFEWKTLLRLGTYWLAVSVRDHDLDGHVGRVDRVIVTDMTHGNKRCRFFRNEGSRDWHEERDNADCGITLAQVLGFAPAIEAAYQGALKALDLDPEPTTQDNATKTR